MIDIQGIPVVAARLAAAREAEPLAKRKKRARPTAHYSGRSRFGCFAARASLSLVASAAAVNGFARYMMPGSRTP